MYDGFVLSITKLRDGVYVLRMDNTFDLAMTCLRVSEWNESPNPRFHHQKFTIAEYIAWYAKTQSKTNEFSYPEDWTGWNIPIDEIKKVYDAGVPDFNHYDALMLGIYGLVSSQEEGKAYVIAVPTDTPDTELDEHELTHAMYCLDEEYQAKCKAIMAEAPEKLVAKLREELNDGGYAMSVVDDEIQAYLTTGDAGFFKKIKGKAFDELRSKLQALHKEHYERFLPLAQLEEHQPTKLAVAGSTPVGEAYAGNAGSNPA